MRVFLAVVIALAFASSAGAMHHKMHHGKHHHAKPAVAAPADSGGAYSAKHKPMETDKGPVKSDKK